MKNVPATYLNTGREFLSTCKINNINNLDSVSSLY